jgi:cytochrome c-type biogenesis protein CcmE
MTKSVLTRVAVSAGVLVGAACLLFYLTLKSDVEFYKHVDEVMVSPGQWYGKPMQLHGFAADVMNKPDTLEYKFQIKNGAYAVEAMYTGVVPDTFKDGSEIVLAGRLAADGFHAKTITAKCPSKYEANKVSGAKGSQ